MEAGSRIDAESLAALWVRADREAQLLLELPPSVQPASGGAPTGVEVEYQLLRAVLMSELWMFDEAMALLQSLLAHEALLPSSDRRAELHYLLCIRLFSGDRPEEAMDELMALARVHYQSPSIFSEACLNLAQGRMAFERSEAEPAQELVRHGLAGLAEAGIHRYVANSCTVLHHLAEGKDRLADRLDAMRRGAAAGRAAGNPVATCNATTGIAAGLTADGDLAQARSVLDEAQALADSITGLPGLAAVMLPAEIMAADAFLHEQQGQLDEAQRLLRAAAMVYLEHGAQRRRYQAVRRLMQLSDMQARAGQLEQARETLREAYEVKVQVLRDTHAASMDVRTERLQRQHAEAAAGQARAHATMLERANLALQESLNLQNEMQQELIEQSRLGALGAMLAGIAHEMNTPLGNALTTLGAVTSLPRQLLEQVQGGKLSRSLLVQSMEMLISSGEVALRNLQRVSSLMSEYSTLELPIPVARPKPVSLAEALAPAWQQALADRPDIVLELAPGPPLLVNIEALEKILTQLFSNVARHACPPGHAGVVFASNGETHDRGWLRIEDHGPGIPPELLPRVFDPYVSGTFGHGRNGLGLFQAQAVAWRQLKGRITAKNLDAGGCRFELQWLLPPRQEPPLNPGP